MNLWLKTKGTFALREISNFLKCRAVPYLQFDIDNSDIDICDARLSTSAPATQDLYLGQLLAISDYKSFGLCSNTNVKVIAVCEANTLDSTYVKELLFAIYSLYTTAVQSPFQVPGGPITSKQFQNGIQQLIQRFNSTASLITTKK